LLTLNAFSSIPLDIEGSNIDCVGWTPTPEDERFMSQEGFIKAKKKGEEKNEKVMFKNAKTQWDSCDCGDGYGCSHGSYVYSIEIKNENKTLNIFALIMMANMALCQYQVQRYLISFGCVNYVILN
jgi:hypothetical protein